MIFKRRHPESLLSKLRNLLWPRMGVGRTIQYYKKRTIRIADTSHSIAAGLALGCAISFTPTLGTHLIQCVFFCWLIRGNWFAAAVGTTFGNPWTFPILFWIAYQVGKAVLWLFGFAYLFDDLPGPLGLDEMLNSPMKLYLPMLIGGYLCALASFPAFYYPFLGMVRGARAARRLRIRKKAHKVAKEVTGQET